MSDIAFARFQQFNLSSTPDVRPPRDSESTLLRDIGPDYILWGTDTPLWAVSQWQIEAFRKFRIPDQLVDRHGYPQLTDEVQWKVFGESAARLWGIDINEKKRQIQLRKA